MNSYKIKFIYLELCFKLYYLKYNLQIVIRSLLGKG
jgi:hypothetical protein